MTNLFDNTDQQQGEQELRQAEAAEARFRGLVESAPDGIVVTDGAGRIVLVNRQAEQLFGYDRNELLGQPVELLVPERLRHKHVGHRNEYLADPRTRPMGAGLELYGRRRDGGEFPCQVALSYEQTEDGLVVTSIIRDTTEYRRLEEQLQREHAELEEQYRLVRETNRRQKVVAALGPLALSATSAELLEVATREIASILDVLFCEVLELLPDRHNLLLRAGVGWREGLVGHAIVPGGADSQAGYTLLSARPVVTTDLRGEARFRALALLLEHGVRSGLSVSIDGPEGPWGILGAHSTYVRAFSDDDVQFLEAVALVLAAAIERARLFADLQASAARNAALLRGAPDAMFIADGDGRFSDVNDLACELTGYRREELLGMKASELTELGPAVVLLGSDALPGAVVTGERAVIRRDGSSFPAELRVALLELPGGARQRVTTVRDLTARREIAPALVRMEKLNAVGQFAAGTAHDISNNLAAILGPVELLRNRILGGAGPGEALLADLDLIIMAVQDAAQTVGRLQLFARQPEDAPSLRREPVQLEELLDDAVALARPRWGDPAQVEERQVRVVTQRGGAPPVLGDPAALREALVNLFTNAADAMPLGGTITVAAGRDTSRDRELQATIAVTDTGVGMDDATQARLFEPFFTTKPIGKGTGLGLVMVHSIIQQMGGSVEVRSRLGEGSTFLLRLPAQIPEQPGQAETADVATVAPRKGLRVLVVEDETTLRLVVGRMLEQSGHVVALAASAEEALEVLSRGGVEFYDVLISDVGLSGMSGWDLVQAVREQRADFPVVLVTGWPVS